MRDSDQYQQFSDLLQKDYRRLYGYIYSLVGDFADTEELLQDTSLVLWQKFDEFDPETNFGSWACQVAKFTVMNFLRKEGRRRAKFSEGLQAHLLDVAATSEEPGDEPWRDALEHCIETLSADQRDLVRHFYEGTKTVSQIASDSSRAPEGIYGSLHHIRRKLLHCMNRRLGVETKS